MKRRQFLAGAAAAGALPAGWLWAVPRVDTRFLLVFLRGGYDAANLLVPVASDFYYEARPNIAVPRRECLEIDGDWGLHPALRESVYPLFKKGEAAFVSFAGSDDLTRSHFETQDGIELGQPLGGRRDYASGFLNRLAVELVGPRAISFTDQLPVVFRGAAKVANASLRVPARAGLDERQAKLIAEMYRDTALGAQVAEGFAARRDIARAMGAEMEAASRGAIGPRNFAREARRIARLMKDAYRLGFVDVGGWDTHINQGPIATAGAAPGYLAQRFEELGRGLAAFADEMGAAWRDTTVVVISEFGRTFRENGNRGTDHGHGTVYWILGGTVRGGRIAGAQQKLARGTLFEDRDYPILNEYRALLGGLFARLYGLNAVRIGKVFAGVAPLDLRVV
jgi:uncharacterized protein (DUF1501 family)